MRLKEFWATVARRWYLVLVAILLSLGVTAVVVEKVGPTYQVDGAALIFPPTAKVDRDPQAMTVGNPYLALNGVVLARDIVIRSLTSKSVADEIAGEIPGSTFEATPDVMTNAPIINITVEASTPEDAAETLTAVLDRIPGILTELQAGLDLDQADVITSQPLIADAEAEVLHKDQIRAGIVALAAALGLGLLMIGLLDGLLVSRKRTGRAGPSNRSSANDDAAAVRFEPAVDPSSVERSSSGAQGATRRLGPRPPSTRTAPRMAAPGSGANRERPESPAGRAASEIAVR